MASLSTVAATSNDLLPQPEQPQDKRRSGRQRVPSQRDLNIYKRCVIQRHDQCVVAMHFEITQSRVAQIVAQVRRWLAAGGAPQDPSIRDHFAQQQLARSKQKLRLIRVIEQATYAMEAELPLQKTTRRRYHGQTEMWRDEISREPEAVNLPALRVLLRAVKALDELETQPELEPAKKTPLSPSDGEMLHGVFELLCRWRLRGEAAGRLPRSVNVAALVAADLNALIGSSLDAAGNHALEEPDFSANTPDRISAPPEVLVSPSENDQDSCDSEAAAGE